MKIQKSSVHTSQWQKKNPFLFLHHHSLWGIQFQMRTQTCHSDTMQERKRYPEEQYENREGYIGLHGKCTAA